MTVQVLRSKADIDVARQELRRRGLSCTSAWWIKKLRNRGLLKGVNVGDEIKSWDVLKTASFLEKSVAPTMPVLDIGAFASEIVCVLHRLKYTALTAVDLNPRIKHMPYAEIVRYEVADFTHTPFAADGFACITAISVLEHGIQSQPLLAEITRLLRPGGFFVASFDYWPNKIDTTGMSLFGMSWTIFSKAEVLDFISAAQGYGLSPCGAIGLEAQERPIESAGKRYTFAWLALQKQ